MQNGLMTWGICADFKIEQYGGDRCTVHVFRHFKREKPFCMKVRPFHYMVHLSVSKSSHTLWKSARM